VVQMRGMRYADSMRFRRVWAWTATFGSRVCARHFEVCIPILALAILNSTHEITMSW
jgi:hypothetical protein